jgi:hypothetical protein
MGNNIIIDIREIWWEFVDWLHLSQDRDHWRALVNTVMDLQELVGGVAVACVCLLSET